MWFSSGFTFSTISPGSWSVHCSLLACLLPEALALHFIFPMWIFSPLLFLQIFPQIHCLSDSFWLFLFIIKSVKIDLCSLPPSREILGVFFAIVFCSWLVSWEWVASSSHTCENIHKYIYLLHSSDNVGA